MSSYDVYFASRSGGTLPAFDVLRAWFAQRPHWKVDGNDASYQNPLTGVELNATLYPERESDMAGDLAQACIWISRLRAHFSIEEVADEIEAFVKAHDLMLADKEDAAKRSPFTRAELAAGHEQHNRWLHDNFFRADGNDYALVLDRARLDEVFRWNRKRDELAEASGEQLFVPQILFADLGERVGTFIAWADGVAARVPKVDSIQTTRAHVPWVVVEAALADARKEDDHWVVDGEALAKVFAAIDRAKGEPPPRIAPPRDVLTKELVAEYLLPPGIRETRRKAVNHLRTGRHHMLFGDFPAGLKDLDAAQKYGADDRSMQLEIAQYAHEKDPLLALRAAERALELGRESSMAPMYAAANAMYAGRWNAALRHADTILAEDQANRNGHLIRATVLTEEMKFDDALAACDRALGIEVDAMAKNVKAFTLAAAGREKEAEALYTSALRDLDASLRESPDDADLHERRAYALLGLGRAKEALAAAKRALADQPEEFIVLQSVGRANVMLDRPKDAMAPLTKALTKRPAAPMAAFWLAKAYAMLGDPDKRDAALRRVACSALFTEMAKNDPVLSGRSANAKPKPSAKAKPRPKAKAKPKPKPKPKPKAKPKPKPKPKPKAKAKPKKKATRRRA